jgi:4-carboxymuconolactone decarboxylase
MTERLRRIPEDRLTPEQRGAIETYKTARRESDISGPWIPLLRSPQVLVRTQALGEHLRYKTGFPPRLSELIILMTARHWSQPYEWGLHSPIALAAGVEPAIVEAIGEGRRPERMLGDQEILYEFCTELLQTRSVTDGTYERALAAFGESGVVEAASMIGYYAMLAAVLNTARTPAEEGMPALPRLQRAAMSDEHRGG